MSLNITQRVGRHLGGEDWREWPVQSDRIQWGVAEAALVFFGAQSLQVLWFGGAASLLWGGDIPETAERGAWTIWVLSFGLWVGYFLGPILMNRVTGSGPMVDFHLSISARGVAIAAAIGAAVQLLVLPALYFPLLRLVDSDPGEAARELAATVDTPLEIFFFFGAAIVLAPIVEEWFYRGMLLPALARRFNPTVGILGSSVVFTLVHIRPILFPGIFALAIVLAVMTMKTRRLAPAIITHMAFNAVTAISLVYF
ncbi:MAG: CPBP family intramembrane glutamic endopeptidase [Actinomycetota bacterium]